LKHGGGDTRPLPRDKGVEELHGDPTVGPRPKVWLDQRLKIEEIVPKMARWRGSDAGQSRRRRVRSYRGCPLVLQEFSFRFILHIERTRKGCNHGCEVGIVDSG